MQTVLGAAVIALLAFGVGFASQRGSVCGVLAARQIVETGKTSRLVAFVTASFWALVVVVPLAWLTQGEFGLGASYSGIGPALLGGALYGAGTVVNGACVFGTASRVLSGKLSFLAALPGIAVGAGLGQNLGLPLMRTTSAASPLSEPSAGAIAVLAVAIAVASAAFIGILRSHRRAGVDLGQLVRAARWRTSLAMLIIGILGGLLFATGTPWTYPSFLRQMGQMAFGQPASFAIPTIVGPLALASGGLFAAFASGSFIVQALRPAQIVRSFAGGTVMGLAATFVPGGNDALLLSALPALAIQGAIAYPAMLAAQLILLLAIKRWRERAGRGGA